MYLRHQQMPALIVQASVCYACPLQLLAHHVNIL
jgi:hypothetical protein